MATKKTKVEIYGETSKYERSMRNVKRVSRSTSQSITGHWSKMFGSISKLSAMFGIAGAAGFVALGKNAIEAGDLIHKLNLRLGLSTESLSQLQHAANLSGVEFNTVAKSFQKMQENISDAGQGIGEAKNALEQIGLDARELQNLSPERQLESIADALLGVANQSDKVRIAADIFGARGVQMLQLMHEGSAGIKEMREEADRLGITLSQSAAQGMADANDAMTRLKTSISGVSRTMIIELAPHIGAVADQMAAWVAQNRELIGQKTHEAIDKIGSSVQAILNIYNSLPEGIVGATGYGLIGKMFFGKGVGGLIFTLEMLAPYFEKLPRLAQDFGVALGGGIPKSGWEKLERMKGMLQGGSPGALSGAGGGFESPLKLTIGGPGQTVNRGEAESYQKLTDDMLGLSVLRGEQMLELDMVQAELLAEQQMAMATTGLEQKTQLETYMAGLLYNDLESMRWNHAQRMMAIAEREKQMRVNTAQNMANRLVQTGKLLLGASGKQNKALFEITKGAAIASAMVSTYKAVMLAKGSAPPPLNYALAAAELAYGLAQVNSIRSQSISGGGGGGGGGVGVPVTSPTTAPVVDLFSRDNETKGSLIINIEGDFIGDEGYVEMLAEKISAAVEDRNVTLVASNARTADEVI